MKNRRSSLETRHARAANGRAETHVLNGSAVHHRRLTPSAPARGTNGVAAPRVALPVETEAPPPSLNKIELRRKLLWHALPGFAPFLLPLIRHDPSLRVIDLIALTVYAAIPTLIVIWRRGTIMREGERDWLPAFIGYPASVLLVLMLFPSRYEFAAAVLAVLAFGDGAATVGGLWLGGPKLPWNRRKTWVGLASFLLFAGPMASLCYWWVANPAVDFSRAALCGLSAALAAGIVETLPLRLNDNIRVGLTAGAVVVLINVAVFGTL